MIVVIGEILFDIIGNHKRIGGAPFNFAFHLQKMGLTVRLMTRIGDDQNGREIIDILRSHQFDLAGIQIDKNHPTGVVKVTLDYQGVPQFDICSDVAYDYLDLDSAKDLDWRILKMVYFGTLSQRTVAGFDQVQRFLGRTGPETCCFCDLNLRRPYVDHHVIDASLHHADVLKLNLDELIVIQSHWGGPAPLPELMAWVMKTFNVKTLALTRGDQGSRVIWNDSVVDAPLPATAAVVDTVGAGDAYAAVLAVGMLKGWPLDRSVALAAEFAARICTISGAIPNDPQLYAALNYQPKG